MHYRGWILVAFSKSGLIYVYERGGCVHSRMTDHVCDSLESQNPNSYITFLKLILENALKYSRACKETGSRWDTFLTVGRRRRRTD